VEVDATLGILMPVVCGITWFGIRRLHHRIAADRPESH